jgi:hypothetical protein
MNVLVTRTSSMLFFCLRIMGPGPGFHANVLCTVASVARGVRRSPRHRDRPDA